MSLSINRVNYAFRIKVQLCFNVNSENRDGDTTPRYFLKPIKLLRVEKVGFTKESRNHGYQEKGNRFWKYKKADELTDTKAEEIWENIKTSYPYGYKENDMPSYLKYILDVKQDEAFQAHYRNYWEKHTSLQKKPILQADGSYDQGHAYPYIEFEINELVRVKFPKGTVPPLDSTTSQYSEYSASSTYYVEPTAYSCHEEDINVYVQDDNGDTAFYIDGFYRYPLTLNSSGSSYNFHLQSGDGGSYQIWPSGGSYANWSGYKFTFSTGSDGTWEGFDEYTTNVQRFVSPQVHLPWYITVAAKDNTHPYPTAGSSNGYVVSGESNQSLDLSLTRGHTYSFSQTGSSNDGHPLYISTDSGGANTNIFPSGVLVRDTGNGEGRLIFNVPYDAPDTLYYQCQNHQYMGGKLNLSDPTAANGDKPGETVRITLNQQKDMYMTYYSSDKSGLGGIMFLKKECDGQVIDF